jgi:hypothetical protein
MLRDGLQSGLACQSADPAKHHLLLISAGKWLAFKIAELLHDLKSL